ncbi:MAG TPA: CusA/CzcA family heavy metal efflux RND transporter [Candidatus Sulfotelmatobacter sp.]|nr:CusA/CzcA family heavy metal efflux RND transporter [Candidatus Sulfotelmatobacter sp.]
MNPIVRFALNQRGLILAAYLVFLAVGVALFIQLNIEAYPDPVPPMVDVVTQSPGQSAEEIERYITIPIEVQLASLPYLNAVRTISLFGLSDVKLQFTYDTDYESAKQQVINFLGQLSPLPNGAQPSISPVSPIGEILRYRVVGPPGFSLTDLKTLEDWVLERRFKAVPGVIDVTSWGGLTKTYDITVDLNKLIAYGVTLPQLIQTINNNNINVGGQTVNIGPQAATVRGVGLIHSMADVGNIMLTQVDGIPVYLSEVATVTVGHEPRLGIAGRDKDDDIVMGIVLMRRGEKSLPTIRRVEAEVEKINSSGILPPGVHLERFYDRSDLINLTTHTVVHNLIYGIVLIFFVQWAFLGDFRSAVVVSATIPFALFFAIAILVIRGESANLLSVGAIDFGLIVDATVIMVENIFRHLSERPGITPRRRIGVHGWSAKLDVILGSASQVNRAIFFSAAIIIASFLPLFTLSGVEGHIFGPMAKTYAYALLGGLLATFLVSPALSALLLPEKVSEVETRFMWLLRLFYEPQLKFALKHKGLTLAGMAALIGLAGLVVSSLGTEFLPKLEEGNLWIRATLPTTISLEEGNGYVNRMRAAIREFPEVVTVVSQHGRPDDGTDATGFFNAEFFVPLKPFDDWPSGVDKPAFVEQLTARLQSEFLGVTFNVSQYIEDNVEEAVSGVKGENSIKLYGNDLATLEETAAKIKAAVKTVRGIADLGIFSSLGQPSITIDIDRRKAARYGLAVGDINAVVQAAIGGQAAGDLYEEGSDRHFPMVVRLAPQYRGSVEAIRNIMVAVQGANGVTQIPLSEVADIKLVSGASFIYREQNQRYIPIKFSVRGRDLGGTVAEAQRVVAEKVDLPAGYRLEWVGEFGNLQEAIERLKIVVPIGIGLILCLLYLNFSSLIDTALVATVIPMAVIGGIFALFITGTDFSVSAAIGFVALFGIAVMEGIILLSYYNHLLQTGLEKPMALVEACHKRLRPVQMTCIAACVGLLPAAISTGIGAQVQRPLAIVVVGGILLAPALILIVLPVLIDLFSRRHLARPAASAMQPAE